MTDVIIAYSLVDHKYYFPRFVLITDLLNQFELEWKGLEKLIIESHLYFTNSRFITTHIRVGAKNYITPGTPCLLSAFVPYVWK